MPEDKCVRKMACFPKKRRIILDQGISLDNFDAVIWLGDFNYRITASNPGVVKLLIESDMWEVLAQNDQFNIEKKIKRVAVGYNEGPINFAPTFKLKKGTDTYN
jgi:hypothetical protein